MSWRMFGIGVSDAIAGERISGKISRVEDIVARIFERFCVGK